jgi:hypothetical protein
MCGFTWRESKPGKYNVTITQETGPFMGMTGDFLSNCLTVLGEQGRISDRA